MCVGPRGRLGPARVRRSGRTEQPMNESTSPERLRQNVAMAMLTAARLPALTARPGGTKLQNPLERARAAEDPESGVTSPGAPTSAVTPAAGAHPRSWLPAPGRKMGNLVTGSGRRPLLRDLAGTPLPLREDSRGHCGRHRRAGPRWTAAA